MAANPGSSTYHSMNVQVTKRLSNPGLTRYSAARTSSRSKKPARLFAACRLG